MAALTADLYVEERWRRHEAGFALVREAEARMRRKGLIRVATGALAASERAARLYERWGFKRCAVELVKDAGPA